MTSRAAALLLFVAGAAAGEEIRVEVRSGVARAAIGNGAEVTEGVEGAARKIGKGVAALEARDAVLLLDGHPVRPPLVLRPSNGPLLLDGRALPGRLEVWAEPAGLVVVNAVDLEIYVAAVVASEMPAGWPESALQAQAIAARTYAVAQKIALGPGARAHLVASVMDQVYSGAFDERARRATADTRGLVLTHRAAPIQAFFSSSCGGAGESGEAAFGLPAGSMPYLPGGDDGDADQGSPRLRWSVARPLAAVSGVLQRAGRLQAPLLDLEVAERTGAGRARTVRLRTSRSFVVLPASELRALIGYRELPSLWFEVRREGSELVFEGRGSGHGAGLCQWGARGRAARGESYQQILSHYYPGATLKRMY